MIKRRETGRLRGTSQVRLDDWQSVAIGSDDAQKQSSPHASDVIPMADHHKALTELESRLRSEFEASTLAIEATHAAELRKCESALQIQLDASKRSFTTAVSAAEDAIETALRSGEPAMAELALAAAEAIVGGPVSTADLDRLRQSVAWAIEELSTSPAIDIYLNPSTMDAIKSSIDNEIDSRVGRIRWHVRPELSEADWVASTSETSIRRVRSELMQRIQNIVGESVATQAARLGSEVSDVEPSSTDAESSARDAQDVNTGDRAE